ncbi:MAG: hypothetical protein D6811_03920 [Alphaproteobacteria bacterium]|nr:MAG: hypothetical protein D6811_03920 [Alphaproteobacteria bacterium]
MSVFEAIWLGLMAIAFVAWVVTMMRTLYRLKARADERLRESRGGGLGTGIANTATTFGEFFTRPEWRRERLRLLLLTVVLFAIIGTGPILWAPRP